VIDAFRAAGSAIAGGLAGGLASGSDGVVSAAAALGSAALAAFKDKLQIKSPSRVFFAAGLQVGAGTEQGLVSKRPAVRRAAAELVETPRRMLAKPRFENPAGANVVNLATARARVQSAIKPMAPSAVALRTPAAPSVAPTTEPTAPPARAAAGGDIVINVTIENINAGSGSAGDIEAAVREGIEKALRGIAANLGAASGRAA
jgi:hypothetical protein